jgi:hypothetical protein
MLLRRHAGCLGAALAGTLGEGAGEVPGVDACHGILPAPCG